MSDRQCSSCGGFCGRGGCKRENVKVNKQREALKLALEVLEEINKLSIGENAICLPAEIDTAMDAIREALAEPEQEPVAWAHQPPGMSTIYSIDPISGPDSIPLYAAPSARKPLTDSEVFNLAADYYEGYGFKAAEFARAIERAHGIGSD